MERLKKAANHFFDLLEIYIPMITFFLVFVLYLIQIIMRYGTFGKIGKYYELCQIMFVWCSVMSAAYGGRTGGHVQFSILYDKCSPSVQLAFRLIGDAVIIVAFVIIFPYACEAIDFLKIKKSNLLRIPFNIIYIPFLVFLLLTTIHYVGNLVKDIREIALRVKGGKKA